MREKYEYVTYVGYVSFQVDLSYLGYFSDGDWRKM